MVVGLDGMECRTRHRYLNLLNVVGSKLMGLHKLQEGIQGGLVRASHWVTFVRHFSHQVILPQPLNHIVSGTWQAQKGVEEAILYCHNLFRALITLLGQQCREDSGLSSSAMVQRFDLMSLIQMVAGQAASTGGSKSQGVFHLRSIKIQQQT